MKLNHNPKGPARLRQGQRGNVLIICMVLASVGAVGAAAFFSLIQARAEGSEHARINVERRTKQSNSVALAREVIYRKYVDATSGPVAAETHTLPDGWGEATISPFSEAPLETNAATRMNKTGGMPSVSYTTDVSVTASDGEIAHPWQVQIKAANPMRAGELLVFQTPTIANVQGKVVGEDLRVEGRVSVWATGPEHVFDLVAERVSLVDTTLYKKAEFIDFDGEPLKPDNFPFHNSTTGRIEGDSRPFYDGRISVVDNPETGVLSYADIIAQRGTPVNLDGTIRFPLFSTDPITLSLPDGSVIHDDNGDGGGSEAGGYPDAAYGVIRQALEALVRAYAISYKAIELAKELEYKGDDHLFPPTPPDPDFDEWHDYHKKLKGQDGAADVLDDLVKIVEEIEKDLKDAMKDLDGPDPTEDNWWPPALPASTDDLFTYNNPYPNGTWENARAGSDGDGEIQIRIAEVESDVRIVDNMAFLTLRGQPDATAATAAKLLDPLFIVATNLGENDDYELGDIEIQGINSRELILAMKLGYEVNGEGDLKVHNMVDVVFDKDTTPNFPEWRILMELENAPLKFNLADAGNAGTLVGGIRTDSSFLGASGTLTIEPDPDLADGAIVPKSRQAWLEAFKN